MLEALQAGLQVGCRNIRQGRAEPFQQAFQLGAEALELRRHTLSQLAIAAQIMGSHLLDRDSHECQGHPDGVERAEGGSLADDAQAVHSARELIAEAGYIAAN